MNNRHKAKRALVQEWDRLSINQIEANVNAIFKDFEEEIFEKQNLIDKLQKAEKNSIKKIKKLKKKLSKYRAIIRYLEK